jgi:hypothetical protein
MVRDQEDWLAFCDDIKRRTLAHEITIAQVGQARLRYLLANMIP